jgi:hypothetical protein
MLPKEGSASGPRFTPGLGLMAALAAIALLAIGLLPGALGSLAGG